MSKKDDDIADRLMSLLDLATDAVRKGDGDMAILSLKEAVDSGQGLSRRSDVICLPDLTNR